MLDYQYWFNRGKEAFRNGEISKTWEQLNWLAYYSGAAYVAGGL